MRLLRVHAPGTDDALAERIGAAVAEFNRTLDIRLRFLSIVIEDHVLELTNGEDAAATVTAALRAHPADVVLLHGTGEVAVAAARTVGASECLLVRMGAGERSGPDADVQRALDRLAAAHLHHGESAGAALAAEGIAGAVHDVGDAADEDVGDRIVRAIGRVRRGRHGGS